MQISKNILGSMISHAYRPVVFPTELSESYDPFDKLSWLLNNLNLEFEIYFNHRQQVPIDSIFANEHDQMRESGRNIWYTYREHNQLVLDAFFKVKLSASLFDLSCAIVKYCNKISFSQPCYLKSGFFVPQGANPPLYFDQTLQYRLEKDDIYPGAIVDLDTITKLEFTISAPAIGKPYEVKTRFKTTKLLRFPK